MSEVFVHLGNEMLGKLGATKALSVKAFPYEDVIPNDAETRALFEAAGRPVIEAVLTSEGEEAVARFGLPVSFNVDAPEVRRLIREQSLTYSKSVTETTRNQVRATLEAGWEAGEGVDDIADRIEGLMDASVQHRAPMIARTEVNGASNRGCFEAGRQNGDAVDGKSWSAAMDERTREDHVNADLRYGGHPIPMDEAFSVGGEAMMYPHDSAGGASQVCGCRCSLVLAAVQTTEAA